MHPEPAQDGQSRGDTQHQRSRRHPCATAWNSAQTVRRLDYVQTAPACGSRTSFQQRRCATTDSSRQALQAVVGLEKGTEVARGVPGTAVGVHHEPRPGTPRGDGLVPAPRGPLSAPCAAGPSRPAALLSARRCAGRRNVRLLGARLLAHARTAVSVRPSSRARRCRRSWELADQLDDLGLELRRERPSRARLLPLHRLHHGHPFRGSPPRLVDVRQTGAGTALLGAERGSMMKVCNVPVSP